MVYLLLSDDPECNKINQDSYVLIHLIPITFRIAPPILRFITKQGGKNLLYQDYPLRESKL